MIDGIWSGKNRNLYCSSMEQNEVILGKPQVGTVRLYVVKPRIIRIDILIYAGPNLTSRRTDRGGV